MTIYKSRQVNLDPEPYYCRLTEARTSDPRHDDGEGEAFNHLYAPRPEFEPTRDPYPYVERGSTGRRYTHPGQATSIDMRYSPRREQFDTPVNPILAAFRGHLAETSCGRACIASLARFPQSIAPDATPAQIDHARRVLQRLANLSKEN